IIACVPSELADRPCDDLPRNVAEGPVKRRGRAARIGALRLRACGECACIHHRALVADEACGNLDRRFWRRRRLEIEAADAEFEPDFRVELVDRPANLAELMRV